MFIAALVCLAVLVYTYFAYPFVIAICARLKPLQVRRDPGHTPMVSAIIPVYNAERFIKEKIESLLAQEYPPERLEILLCSDCSEDDSDKMLADYAKQYPDRIRVFRSETRAGKPSAINLMRKEAKGDLLLMTDIRQPLNTRCVRELASYFSDPKVGAVSGNLILQGGTGAGFYWKYEKWIRQSEGQFRSLVGVSGSIYAIRAEGLIDMPPEIILDDMWVPMRLRLLRQRVVFAPEAQAFDEAFEDDREFGRKTRTLAGNYQLFATMPRLLIPFLNPSWFETFSHKILRLVCPWALLGLLVVSAVAVTSCTEVLGEFELRALQVLLAGQGAFYLLALMGKKLGKLGNIARTFVVMNYAAVIGLWKFLSQSQRITW